MIRSNHRRTAAIGLVLALAVTLAVAVPAGAGAQDARPRHHPRQNAVLDWSAIAEATISAGRPPGSSFVLAGIVHAAMYDAVVAIRGGHGPFLVDVDGKWWASVSAAVATAAHGVLVARVPAQAANVGAQYLDYLDGLRGWPLVLEGIRVGTQVADAYIAARAADGFNNVVPFVQPPTGPGVFEPVAPTEPVDVKLKQVTPLVMTSPGQLRPDGPDALNSAEYAADLNEVKAVGRATGGTRTPEQTEVAQFWAEHTYIQWSRTIRNLTSAKGLDVGETARMMAMAYVSTADASIGCFEAKYWFNFWRPNHAIQRADTDDNPATDPPDPAWAPLLTVNHPEYPSGHACVTSAITTALATYFGTDHIAFTMDSTVAGTTVHAFDSFSDSLDEVIEARIWSGLHFRNSMEEGATFGTSVANLVTSTRFA
jgi:hypothetical protein